MSDVDDILAGVIDAEGSEVPQAFADWVEGQIEDRQLRRERDDAERPEPEPGEHHATTEVVEYDLDDLLGEAP